MGRSIKLNVSSRIQVVRKGCCGEVEGKSKPVELKEMAFWVSY